MEQKIIQINEWKQNKEKQKEEDSVLSYLQALSFGQLITESRELLLALKKNPYNSQLILMAKMMIKDIEKRLKSESPQMSESLSQLSSRLKSIYG